MKTTVNESFAGDYSPVSSKSEVKDFISLLKPRVMSLVIFSGLVGLLIAPGNIHPFIATIAIFSIALGSGASAAINMWYDRDIDAIMQRTIKRPIPLGKVDPDDALTYGVMLGFISVLMMSVCVNYVAGFLLLAAILFYVFIYTMWLKRSTPQNIVIGGAAGAFPPMIGWSAVTGDITIEPIILFMIIFFWTPPHFWALALYRNSDYQKAGIPMLPCTNGVEHTKMQIVIYSVIMILSTLLPIYAGFCHEYYFVGSFLLNIYFLHLALKLFREQGITVAPRLFGYSIIYLFAIFGLMVFDNIMTV